MRKWIVLVIVLALAAAVAITARNLDAYLNRNRVWLADRLGQALGRKVSFDEIGVSFAGGLGVRIKGVRIADDPAFARGDVLRADGALIRIRLLPALRGRYEISRIALEHPLLTVRRTADGLNVSPLDMSRVSDARRPAGSNEGAGGSAVPAAAALVIAYIDVDGGKVRYVDSTTYPPARLELDALDFTASDVRTGKPVAFDMQASVLGAATPNVHARGSVGPLSLTDPAETPLRVEMRATDVSLAQLTSIPGFESLREALAIDGPMSLAATANGTWDELGFAATFDARGAQVRFGDVLDKAAGVPLSIDVAGTRNAETIVVERATLALLDTVISSSGTIVTGEEPRYDVALNSGTIALAGWEHVVPGLAGFALDGAASFDLYLQRTAASSPVSLGGSVSLTDVTLRDASGAFIEGLSTTMKLDGTHGTIPPATFRIAGTPATLTAELSTASKPTLTFTLECDTLPLSGATTASPAGATSVALRGVKIDGALRMAAGSLKLRANALSTSGSIGRLAYTDLAADVRAGDGRIVLSPITAAALGGSVRGEGVYDLRDRKRPSFNFETNLTNVRVNALATALGGPEAAVVDGVADARLSLAGSGLDWSSIVASLVGGGDVELRDGALRDTNLVRALLTSLSGLPGLSEMLPPDLHHEFPALFGGNDTPFDRLAAHISIADGRMSSDDILVQSPDFSANGRGHVGFDRSIDVRAAIELSEALSNELVARAGVLQRVADHAHRVIVPVRIDGTLPDVRARPDLEHVAHALQRGAVDDFVEGILDRERKRIEHGAPPPAPTAAPSKNAAPSGDAGPPTDWFGAPAPAVPVAPANPALP